MQCTCCFALGLLIPCFGTWWFTWVELSCGLVTRTVTYFYGTIQHLWLFPVSQTERKAGKTALREWKRYKLSLLSKDVTNTGRQAYRITSIPWRYLHLEVWPLDSGDTTKHSDLKGRHCSSNLYDIRLEQSGTIKCTTHVLSVPNTDIIQISTINSVYWPLDQIGSPSTG